MKPVLIAREEFIHDVQDAITKSGLPAFVLEPVIVQILSDVRAAVRKEYEDQKHEYEHEQETSKD